MNTTALAFRNTTFDIIDRNNQPWLRSGQLAQALGYTDERSITKIFSRNTEEFSDAMTSVVKLTPQGEQARDIRIFSMRGAHLLAMLSRTKIAKEFRKWVLDILDKETAQQKYSASPADTLTLEQCDQLRGMMLEAQSKLPKAQAAKFAISGWSKLRAHFGVAYRLIPQHKFQDALALVSRHVSAQPVLPDMNSIFMPEDGRYLIAIRGGRVSYNQAIPDNACVLSQEDMLKAINEPNGLFVTTPMLADFAVASVKRLAQRCEYYEAKDKAKPAKSQFTAQGKLA